MAPEDPFADSRHTTFDSSSSGSGKTSFDRRAAIQMTRLLFGRARAQESAVDVLELERALRRLAELSQSQYRVVKLRLLEGLSVEQAARQLDVPKSAAEQDWRVARAWLRRELGSRRRDGPQGE